VKELLILAAVMLVCDVSIAYWLLAHGWQLFWERTVVVCALNTVITAGFLAVRGVE
jgi:hypothetical protein